MDYPFEVGEIYQNRIGAYEVIRLDEAKDTMLVRYLDSGEETELTLSMQARIWRNMSWEEQQEARERAAAEARQQKGYGEDFAGLAPTDFKTNVAGTSWRSRRSLAGRVAKLLSNVSAEPSFTFVSWSVYRWPVAFMTRLEDYSSSQDEAVRKAKFTIELDESNVYFGFYIEKGKEDLDQRWDWTRLFPALRRDESLQNVIAAAEDSYNCRFLARTSDGDENYHFADGLESGAKPLWDEQSPSALTVPQRLQRIEAVPAGRWLEFYLIATLPKAEALAEGVRVAHRMAGAMEAMLPLYSAAVLR